MRLILSPLQEDRIQFHIVSPPSHGQLQIERDGSTHETVDTFMMADIYDNKITYTHDGSDTLKDELKFTVSDGTNPLYKIQSDDGEITVSRPQVSGRCLEEVFWHVVLVHMIILNNNKAALSDHSFHTFPSFFLPCSSFS